MSNGDVKFALIMLVVGPPTLLLSYWFLRNVWKQRAIKVHQEHLEHHARAVARSSTDWGLNGWQRIYAQRPELRAAAVLQLLGQVEIDSVVAGVMHRYPIPEQLEGLSDYEGRVLRDGRWQEAPAAMADAPPASASAPSVFFNEGDPTLLVDYEVRPSITE